MKKNNLLVVLLLFVSAITMANTFTWGPTGHRATGKIAEKHLKRSVKRKIKKLLQGESLAFVSTYADEIKSDRKKYGKYYSWHYVSIPFDKKYKDISKNKGGDIITGIRKCIAVLKDEKSTVEEKRFFLKMLVHLMGDLHQPLHIGRKEDKGGNTIQVKWHGRGTNLHKVWDEKLLNKWGMSYLELAANTKQLSKEEIKNIQKGDVLDWVEDTRSLTKRVYNSVESGSKLSYGYSYEYLPVVRTQLQKGGLRLAKLLNEIF